MIQETVQVKTPSKTYDVCVGTDLIDQLGELVKPCARSTQVFVVSDTTVAALYGARATASLKHAGLTVSGCVIPAGEKHKTMATLTSTLEHMAAAGCDRDTLVVALGGGVVGDLAGFAAATYMRGVAVVQVPTSLLAMVDSSVGGKTAVDLKAGKNLAGAFLQPSKVIADVACLKTIEPQLLNDSIGEVIKHAVLASPELFSELTRSRIDALPLDLARLSRIVAQNVRIKRDVVESDERERGLRQTLNLGHTIGHAVEAASGYTLGHGASVAAGLCIVSRGAAALGLTPPELAQEIEACVAFYGLPTTFEGPSEQLLELIMSDKKRHGQTVNIVVPKALGHVEIVPMSLDQVGMLTQAGL